jgi:hypothetical protein
MMKILERTVGRQGVSNSIFEWARLVFLMAGEVDTKLKHRQEALGHLPNEKSLMKRFDLARSELSIPEIAANVGVGISSVHRGIKHLHRRCKWCQAFVLTY